MGWAQSGKILQLQVLGPWYCLAKESEWDVETDADRERIRTLFHSKDEQGLDEAYPYGDRRQEIVIIGTGINQPVLEEELDMCLLNQDERQVHSTDLPFGAYPNPFEPVLINCDDPGTVFMIARPHQNQHFSVPPGFCFTILNLSLNMTSPGDTVVQESDVKSVKVFLDKNDAVLGHGVLLATFRPGLVEQHATSIAILPCDDDNDESKDKIRRIRVQVVLQNQGRKAKKPRLDIQDQLLNLCEVHIMGKVEPVPYHGNEEDEEDDQEDDQDDDHDHDRDCDHVVEDEADEDGDDDHDDEEDEMASSH